MEWMRRLLIALVLAIAGVGWGQNRTFVALGDSVAFGYQPNDVTRSSGDKGYVRLFADWLGVQYGTRPALSNLAIPGESTASYFDTSEIGGLLNSNYPILFRPSQRAKADSTIVAALNAGRQIPYVTFSLGANDLLELLDATFLAQPLSMQIQVADQAIAAAEPRLTTALTALRQRLPNAILLIPGYYNPYPPTRAEYPIASYAIPRLNSLLRAKAREFDGRFAVTDAPFVGNELSLTWIGEDDVHPRDAGYQVIYQQILANVRLISGQVLFGDFDPSVPLPATLTFEIRTPSGLFVRDGDLFADGTFRLTAPTDAFAISLKRSHWLRRTRLVDTSLGDVSGLILTLVNGDVDEDDEVGIGDFALFSPAFGTEVGEPGFLGNADLNGDGVVDIADYAILSTNFGLLGDD